jgi:hypothetical protein
MPARSTANCGASTARWSAPRGAPPGAPKKDHDEPADHALGRSRGEFSTKIHILCDGHGHPLHFHLTAGQAHETTAFVPLLEGADERVVDGDGEPVAWPLALAGDKGYRAAWIDEALLEIGIAPMHVLILNADINKSINLPSSRAARPCYGFLFSARGALLEGGAPRPTTAFPRQSLISNRGRRGPSRADEG